MTNSEISIRLGNNTARVSARAFVDSINHTLTILGCVEAEVTKRESGSIKWMIRELSFSSPALATLGAEQDTDVSAQVVSASIEGLDVLSRGQSHPRYFPIGAVKAAKDLSKISDDTGYALRIIHRDRIVSIANLSDTSVAETSVEYFRSIGSVEGRLESATVRNRPHFRVYDAVHDRGVTCHFSDPQLEQVRNGLGKRVIVSGYVRSDQRGNPESIRVSTIEVADDTAKPVSPSDLRGLWKGETEGQKAEQYLREVRGDY